MSNFATYSPEDDKIRITPSARLDKDEYLRVKAAGYRWAPMQKLFYAVWTPAAEDIALELCGEIDDEDKSLVERAEDRAERFEEYADNRREDSERAHAAVSAIADNIPLGQPILVGHHSEKHARRDAAKIENGMRKAVAMWKQAQYWKDRAAGALSHAKYKELPQVRARRIKTLEADLRQQIARYTPCVTKDRPEPSYCMQQKWGDCYPHDGTSLTSEQRDAVPEKLHVWTGPAGRGGTWTAVEDLAAIEKGSERYREHLANRLEYEYAMLGEQIGADSFATKFDYAVGGKITVRRESVILTILKLNKKDGQIVSVSTNSKRWTRVVPVEDIVQYEPPAEGAAEQIKAATKRTGPCNYPGVGFATCSMAQWSKINKDYKSTIHRIEATETHGAHYVRWALGVYLTLPPVPTGDSTEQYNRRHSYYPVYITDEKRKDPPAVGPTPAPTVPVIEHSEAAILAETERMKKSNERRELERAEAAPFEALQASLKAGVKVVSANQLFPTPSDLAARMCEKAELKPEHRILEPSAGTGRLLEAIGAATAGGDDSQYGALIAIEINHSLIDALRRNYEPCGVDVRRDDFLDCEPPSNLFDRIVMNPPFENGADIKHILHALTFLKPGGRLVAICANGPRQNEKLKPLADSWEELPAGTFEGTQVRSVLLVINKPEESREEAACDQAGESPAIPTVEWVQFAKQFEAKIQDVIDIPTAGRSWPALKEGKVFDSERLSTSPLFDRKLF